MFLFFHESSDPNQYTTALQSLKRKYGHPLVIAKANLAAIGNLPYVRSGDVQSLEKFTGCLSDVISSLTRAGLDKEISSFIATESVLKKLPNHLKFEWGEQSTRDPRNLNLLNLNDWLQNKVFSQKIVTSSSDHPFQNTPNTTRPQNSISRFPSRVHQTTARTAGKLECLQCKGDHTVENCEDFKRGTVADRLALLRRMGACFTCFKIGHRTKDCRKARKCDMDNCNRNHHQLLHDEQRDITIMAGQLAAPELPKTALGTIRVRVQNDTGVETKATLLFDEGSDTTLVHNSLTRRLDIIEKGTRHLTPGYEIPLPWKTNEPNLQNNRAYAIHRLNGLCQRFRR